MNSLFPQTLRRDRRGSAAVEFGFTAPLVILALVGCIETGRAFWIRAALQYAAEETVRYAMVNADADDATLTAMAQDKLFGGMEAEDATFTVNRETLNGTDFVSVRGEYPFSFVANLLSIPPATLTGSARASQSE